MARFICLSPPQPPSTTISDHHCHSLSLLSSSTTTIRDFQKLHAHFITTGLVTDPTTATHLLSFVTSHTSFFSPSDALIFLSRIPNPNSYAYTTTIQNLSRSANPYLAISLFVSMLTSSSDAKPQNRTFPPLFSAYAKIPPGDGDGKQLHSMVVKMGLSDTDPVIRNSILAMYAGYGHLAACCGVFRSCLHRFDPVTWNTMITALVKSGFVEEAREMFDEMPDRDRTVVTWSTMINGYVRHKRYSLALELFRSMQTVGSIIANPHIIVSLLSACGALGALKQGEWAHRFIDKTTLSENYNIKNNPHVQTALVGMYCKCGSIEKAVELFESCPSKPLSTWNSLIYGLGMHGRGHDSLRLFSKLVTSSGLRPDGVTFVAVLTALNHSGMVDEGREIFATMTDAYGVIAGIEHYGCMIDLLGRGGFVEEAKELIERMPMSPDLAIWGSLLSACWRVGDVETGRRAAERVMELDPTDSSGYVVLANTHAGAGEFGGALKIRVTMKERKVERVPGSSSVEVNGVVYEFVG